MRIIVLALLFFLIPLRGAGQTYTLKGKTKDRTLVLFADCDSAGCNGTYFYNNALKDIRLGGTKTGKEIRLHATMPALTDTVGQITLKHKRGNEWKCIIADTGQKKRKLKLHARKESYEDLRTSFFKTTTDSKITRGKYTVELYHVAGVEAYGLRITGGLDTVIANKINSIVYKTVLNLAAGYCTCMSDYGIGEMSSSLSYYYIDEHLLSVVMSTGYDCGGAHPDEYTNAFNFNLDDGQQLQLPEVLQLFDSTDRQVQNESESSLLTDEYTEALMELLTVHFPTKMVAEREGQGCDYTDYSVWQESTWHFHEKGIWVAPSFRHLNNECGDEDWSVIPWAVVRDYLDVSCKLVLP